MKCVGYCVILSATSLATGVIVGLSTGVRDYVKDV